MKKIITKYSKLSTELKKVVKQKLETEDVKFFNFPYQGNIEEGFLLEGEEINYLVILDTEKKSKYKPTDDEDEDEEDDDFTTAIADEIPDDVVVDDEFKVDDAEDVDEIDADVEDFDDDEDIEDVAEDDFDDDEK